MDVSEFSPLSSRSKSDSKPYYKLPAWLSSDERGALGTLSLDATWEQGRQGTGYEKFDLMHETGARWVVRRALDTIGNPALFDAWLLHYPVGSETPVHTDPAYEGMCHVRLNALVVASAGGLLRLEDEELPLSEGDAYVFRPDTIPHSVTTVQENSRLIVSVGANMEHEQAHELGLA